MKTGLSCGREVLGVVENNPFSLITRAREWPYDDSLKMFEVSLKSLVASLFEDAWWASGLYTLKQNHLL